ncbi:hypothetical protein [Pseudomonas aeruginosa]|uniref:hypothetical protein n=1 Tax=Pseudomonas aeruginosa TaxID=287 RepID=UPI0024BEF1D9|nr:hypothetical protein [Pseudomonas aeruginosa]MDJ1429162.1 hypothetical protein [Pseudomonas aeruginosa]
MNDYKSAFNAAAADISAIIALLGFTKYPGVDPVLRAIADLILEKAESQVLREERDAANKRADTLEHRMMGMMTRHFAEAWHNRDTQKALDGYLSAGIAQLEQAEQAEAERPEVVGVRYEDGTILSAEDCGTALEVCAKVQTPLMTVAQHERIVGALRFERQQMDRAFTACINERDAADARLHEVATACATAEQERDVAQAEVERLTGVCASLDSEKREMEHKRDAIIAMRDAALAEVERIKAISDNYYVLCVERQQQLDTALARVAELTATRNRYGVDAHYFNKNLQRILRDFESFTPDELARSLIILAKVADEKVVAQAQHSVPEGWKPVPIEPLLNMMSDKDHDTRITAERQLLSILAAAPGNSVPQAWLDVQAERRRQITAEGWTPEHDDLYCAAELPRAAAAYILNGANDEAPAIWPFSAKWWKPRDARANYVRAAALILAEIERLDRAGISQSPQPGATTASS